MSTELALDHDLDDSQCSLADLDGCGRDVQRSGIGRGLSQLELMSAEASIRRT